jgi:hypothetical protein
MSIYDKSINNVADAASKIMAEKLHPNQQKLDVHEPEKDKLTADDFKKLRAKKEVKEEAEQLEELSTNKLLSYRSKAVEKLGQGDAKKDEKRKLGIGLSGQKVKDRMTKEETEQLQEYEAKSGVYKHQGTYGRAKGVEHGDTDYDKENEMAKSLDKPKKPNRAKYGARQNFNRSTRVNEDFSNLIDSFKSGGLKALEEGMKTRKEMKEEADNEQFHAEVEKAKKKNSGEDRNDKGVAAASVQAVKNEQTHTEIQVIDMTDPYDIKSETIDLEERSLSEPEADKKEEIVKSMKKKMSGFKERYGDRAKEVMYATATKIAKKD